MKRFLAVLLSLILASGSLFVAAFAADGKKEKVYPVILLQGYSGPKLFNQDTGEKAWGLDFDKVKEHVLNDYGKELANGAKEYAKGNPDPLVDTLGTILLDVMDPIACNADGSSKYNLAFQVKKAVPRKAVQHMVKKSDAGRQIRFSGAVQI